MSVNDFSDFNKAMASFQKEYESPKKDKKVDYTTKSGQRIKYDYADLESLQSAIRVTAAKHGLSWNIDFDVEQVKVINYGKEVPALLITPEVIISHSSGVEKLFKGVPLYATSLDPQSIGSIKTYAERYALSSAFGIASDDDDDAQIAVDQHNNQQHNNSQQPTQAELDQELDQTIQEYRNFLLDRGLDLGEMNKYIIKKEMVDNINQVERVRVMGYLKSQVQKIKNEEARKESEQNEQTEQQSLMKGNTTQTINWGSAE